MQKDPGKTAGAHIPPIVAGAIQIIGTGPDSFASPPFGGFAMVLDHICLVCNISPFCGIIKHSPTILRSPYRFHVQPPFLLICRGNHWLSLWFKGVYGDMEK
jgi:hypothetical protein